MVTTPASLLVHAVSDSGINYSWHFSSGFWAKSFHRQAKKAGFHAPPQFKFPRWRQKPSICVTFLPALHWIVLIRSWSSRKESNTKWSWSLKYNHRVSSPRPMVRNCEIWAVTCFYSEILLFQAFVALLYELEVDLLMKGLKRWLSGSDLSLDWFWWTLSAKVVDAGKNLLFTLIGATRVSLEKNRPIWCKINSTSALHHFVVFVPGDWRTESEWFGK